MNRTALQCAPVGAAIVIAVTGPLLAGPLDPPAGPIASTPGPEPRVAVNATNTPGDGDSVFKITQPGSYYLAGNITGVVGRHGIEIAAEGVALDLMGFDLVGVPGMGNFDGVSVTAASLRNITVVNGSVRDWGGDGVDLSFTGSANCRVEGVLSRGNAGDGISVGQGSTVTSCSVHQNTGSGITTGNGCTTTNCSAYQNTGGGIGVGNACTVTACSSYTNNDIGISAGTGCTISTCSAVQNTGTGSGISVGNGSTVESCTTRLNTRDGIVCSSDCVIRGNTCSSNGNGIGNGAGILATSGSNRIEGNTCTDADRGIDVDGFGNFVIQNTCSGNSTNWSIVAANYVGLVILAPPSQGVSGDTGGIGVGSTNPWANFTY